MGKHSKKSKKHKKHSKKKRHSSSSSEEEWIEADSLKKNYSSDSSMEEPIKKKKRKDEASDETNMLSSASGSPTPLIKTSEREEWMSLQSHLTSFSNDNRKQRREEEKKKKKEAEQYNPATCPRELNVYWKDGGDGFPKFKKPQDDERVSRNPRPSNSHNPYQSQSRWRKEKPESSTSTKREDAPKPSAKSVQEEITNESEKPMSEKELNLLAGKLVKAEIMGNHKLVAELKEKLENGRKLLSENKLKSEEVLLTQVNRQGHSKPLTLRGSDDYGKGKKQRKKPVETHASNERVRYFPDDDKYSLKQMFENEKFSSASDQDATFMKIASTLRKNDDMDDFFTDSARRTKSENELNEATRSKAISEHKKVSETLDNCSKCIQSSNMQKHLIIAMGEYVYLSVPAHEPLVPGHCLIVPIRHVTSCTQLDENEWDEIKTYRKTLVKMYGTKEQEPMFFEVAVGFHRYPHMVLECIPLAMEEASLAPMYFKKAIDESETEWAQNKKLVSLKGRDVRQAIPKELPYFCISFGMEEGFAHVIEDEQMFPRNFAQEIIGGMLDLDQNLWRKPKRQAFDMQSKRALSFTDDWNRNQ